MLAAASPPDVVFLFASAGLVLYVASRAAVDAMTPTSDPSPGRMALGQWMPIAWCALLPALAGRSEVAIAVVFSTSVAALALNLGILTILSPPAQHPAATARAWPFVIPAGLMALLAGFSGSLAWWHALMMLLLGLAVWSVWRAPAPVDGSLPPPSAPAKSRRLRVVQLLLAILLGGVGAWLAFQAVVAADARTRVATAGLISLAVLAPLLVLPILGTGSIAAQNGRMGAVMSTIVGIVLLNLCCLLPLVVLGTYGRNIALAYAGGTRELPALIERLRPVPFPLAAWRVDTVLLLVLGLLLVPVSLGRWTLSRAEGAALTGLYVAYIILSAALAIRM